MNTKKIKQPGKARVSDRPKHSVMSGRPKKHRDFVGILALGFVKGAP